MHTQHNNDIKNFTFVDLVGVVAVLVVVVLLTVIYLWNSIDGFKSAAAMQSGMHIAFSLLIAFY